MRKKSFDIIKFNNKPFYGSYYCLCLVINNKRLNRLNIINKLNKEGVGTSIYYPKPIPEMTYYRKKYRYKNSEFKNAQKFSYRSIALPLGTHLKQKDLNLIVNSINKVL